MTHAKSKSEDEPPRENLEEQLEEGLEDSFPASDPPSVARRHRAPPSGGERGGDADGEDR